MITPTTAQPHLPLLAPALHPSLLLAKTTPRASLQRMAANLYSKPLVRSSEFICLALGQLPEVAAFIDEGDIGVLHLEVGALELATRDAFARSDFTAVRKHLSLVADLFERADAPLYDALRISYLESLFLGETTAAHIAARGMLSRQMERALWQAEQREEKRRSLQACHPVA